METPKEYYYTYYSYEEWGMGYFGSRGCKCLPEEDVNYFGSFYDKNFKPTQKIILKDDYATREEAYADEIILQRYYKVVENPHFANQAYQSSTRFFYRFSKEEQIKNASKGGIKTKEMKKGIHALTFQERSENSKKIGRKHKELGTGIFSIKLEEKIEISKKAGMKSKNLGLGIHGLSKEQIIANCSKGGIKTKEMNKGVHARTKEQMSRDGKKGGTKTKELNKGVHGRTKKQMSRDGKIAGQISSSQRWMCLETGHITNAGALTNYQKSRGIDTTKRKRIT